MEPETTTSQRLCYVDATRVACTSGDLAGATVETAADEHVGTLDGVLIDPDTRRVHYLVIERTGWLRRRRYVIPTEVPAQVDAESRSLRVDLSLQDLPTLDELDRAQITEFTEEDYIRAMFARRVA